MRISPASISRSELEFASLLTYSPYGTTREARASSSFVRVDLKLDRRRRGSERTTTHLTVARLVEILPEMPFADWMHPDVALVPVPKSSLMRPDTLWVPDRLVREMVSFGLGRESPWGLRRTTAIQKASMGQTAADRPNYERHYQSLAVERRLGEADDFLLVDDVVTTGAALMGACWRLEEAVPEARIRGFAVVRTLTDPERFQALRDPCVGQIRVMPGGRTKREP